MNFAFFVDFLLHFYTFFTNNKGMLDLKSKLVLKILQKECRASGYKVVDKADIISALPSKFRMDEDGLDHIITFLERSECIHVKYDDERVYCLCILPLGNQLTEKDTAEKKERRFSPLLVFLIFFAALIGGFVGGIVAKFINL